MQIEKIEFLSPPENCPGSIEFKPDRLNLLTYDDELERNRIFASILASLQIKHATDNGDNAAVSALADGVRLSFFINGASCSFELAKGAEPGSDFKLNFSGTEKSGWQFVQDLQPEILESLFILSEERGRSFDLLKLSQRVKLLGQFAGMSEQSASIDKAVKLVEERLENYPFRGKNYSIESLLSGISRGKIVLEERLQQLEVDRDQAAKMIEDLRSLEQDLDRSKRAQTRDEYFQLCIETAELDSRIMKVQHRLLHEAELRRELASLSDIAGFPIDSLRKVQEWWTMRQARLSDFARISEDLKKQEEELRERFEGQTELLQGLSAFGLEDAQDLYSLARNIVSVKEELEQLKQERDQEMRRVKEDGVDFDSISLVRKSLLALPQQDLEDANSLSEGLKLQKDRLASVVEAAEKDRKALKILDSEIEAANAKSRRIKAALSSFAAGSAVLAVVLYFVGPSHINELLSTILLTCFVLALVALAALPKLLSGFRKDLQEKVDSLTKQQSVFDAEELRYSNEIASIQKKAESIAKIHGYSGVQDLFKKLQSYANFSARLKQLDLLDNMLLSREQHLRNLEQQGIEYLEKAKRPVNVFTPESITGLASEIIRHKETARELERSESSLNSRKQEIRFLEGEIKELNGLLEDSFAKANVKDSEEIDKRYAEFERKAQLCRKWEEISNELKRMATTMTMEIFEDDLSVVLSKLQHRRTKAWDRMQDLIGRYPEILSEALDDSEIQNIGQGSSANIEEELEKKQQRADDLRTSIRAVLKNFDEFHPKTQLELEVLDRDLKRLSRDKQALLLASEALKKLAQDCKSSWSQELNGISAGLISGLGLEITELNWSDDMSMSMHVEGIDAHLDENSASRLVSRGTYKLANWIVRLLLCRYVGSKLNLPLVLDEPFSDLDDKRFVSCMNLLIEKILPHCQIVIVSCQQARYKWFLTELSAEARSSVFEPLAEESAQEPDSANQYARNPQANAQDEAKNKGRKRKSKRRK